MCGISAIVTSRPLRLRETIDAMTDSMVHRGPDDRGVSVLEDEGVALGMRRLSIVDIDGGHQPMWSDGDRHCLVFNGEIYNAPDLRRELGALGQRFRSDHSDTEVLVHGFARWGNQSVEPAERYVRRGGLGSRSEDAHPRQGSPRQEAALHQSLRRRLCYRIGAQGRPVRPGRCPRRRPRCLGAVPRF